MIESYDPLQLQLTTYAIGFLDDIFLKYQKISEISGKSIPDCLRAGKVHLLQKHDFFFYKMFHAIDFNYELELMEVKNEFQKILSYQLKGQNILLTPDYIEIEGKIFPHDADYNEYIPHQSDVIEFVVVCFLYNKITPVKKRMADKAIGKEFFDIDEAAAFTGYKKSYLYKAKGDGYLKAFQAKEGGKLRFKREDLLNFVFRRESVTLDELL